MESEDITLLLFCVPVESNYLSLPCQNVIEKCFPKNTERGPIAIWPIIF